MKTIQLQAIQLRNFKGIKEFGFVANGKSIDIYGDNATGKTTIFDAFTWCLFGKNSNEQKAFTVKALDADGNEIHKQENEVEITLLVDGKQIKLKRVYFEKWSVKNGTQESSYSNSTKYYIDDVPVSKQADFDAAVNEIVDEETFKLLTNPLYFNTVLKWERRRELLLKICGDVSDADVIAANNELKELPALLEGKTIDQRKLQIAEQMKSLKTEIKEIPSRIDELSRSIPEETGDTEFDRGEVERIQGEIETLRTERATVTSGASVINKQADLKVLDAEIASFTQSFISNSGQATNGLKVSLQEKEANLSIAQSKVKQLESELQGYDIAIKGAKQIHADASTVRKQLLMEHKPLKEAQYVEPEMDCNCPTCKQVLPYDQINQARETAKEAWKLENSRKMAEIVKEGKAQAERIKEMEQRISILTNERNQLFEKLEQAQADVETHQKALNKVQQQLHDAQAQVPNIEQDEAYQALQARKQALQSELNALQAHTSEVIVDIDEQITALQKQKVAIDAKIAQVAHIDVTYKRINELEEQQQGYVMQLERLEKTQHLINQFERVKVKFLDERINSNFKMANFQLFIEQQNSGIKETCNTTYNGVPFNDLNNAARINVGLDIIATLQRHFATQAVVFIDNRESVTKLYGMDNQIISLFVSEQDKQLRVEGATATEEPTQPTLFDEVI